MRDKASDVIAVCAADLQLDHNPPGARAVDFINWHEIQGGYLKQIKKISEKHNGAAIVFAGDIFDHWMQPPEFMNYLMIHFPHCYAVPGNHDLPNQNYGERHKSAYQTMVECGRIHHLDPFMAVPAGKGLVLTGFPWGFNVRPNEADRKPEEVHIAVVHAYIWRKNCTQPKALQADHQGKFVAKLKGYQGAVFGDNHKGFLTHRPGLEIFNCGAMIRRHADEIDSSPRVGLVHRDGTITTKKLDVSLDKFVNKEKVNQLVDGQMDLAGLVAKITDMGVAVFDYFETLINYVGENRIEGIVKDRLLEAADIARKNSRIKRRLE